MKTPWIALALATSLVLPGTVAHAATTFTTCPDDYYSYILDVQDEVIRWELIHDFITTSTCQLNDILILMEELEDLKDDFRSAAMACEYTADYKAKYLKLTLEIYYVRHLYNFKENIFPTANEEEVQAHTQELLDNVEADMIQKFVNEDELLSEDLLNLYFAEWSEKYAEKITGYAFCSEGPWGQVAETWNDTIEDMKSTKQAIEDIKEALHSGFLPTGDLFQVDLEDPKGFDEIQNLQPMIHGIYDYFKALKELGKSEIEGPETPASLSGSSSSLNDAFMILQNSELLYNLDLEYQSRKDEYTILYGEAGAKVSSNLEGMVADWTLTIHEANTVHLPQILELLEGMSDRQCN